MAHLQKLPSVLYSTPPLGGAPRQGETLHLPSEIIGILPKDGQVTEPQKTLKTDTFAPRAKVEQHY